ncbi:NUDIX hydrolase [Spirosoma utsteinense]|uniref:GDP-mannose pyrophosphatase n=1 Tax=Spirosoma utsteinense TaxID=2585773 RepID=A0ABR6W2P4_9BACT|nr:NUDIX domain-containing protein [Spirosoma utsteinense]MBC3784333.1 8-oxo-dGTP pyrophosphatase MutT (NUDIX family) [Spirosoma utsteinense]MBC3790868.1 8-oxo-dGTP pyrophosphatase MutT (NUDIX family) [Spirosoma utsteinense]
MTTKQKPEALEDAPKFKFWKNQMETNGLKINGVSEKYVRHRHNGEVLFAMLEVDADTPEGDKIPPALFLKGHAASVLVCLIDKDTQEKFVVLVRQRRISDGSHTYEHPAGMVDADDAPDDVAARELGEEIGLAATAADLTKLNSKLWFPSTGTSDEAMHFFYLERALSRSEIMAFHHKDMGNASEFERITTVVTTLPEAHKLVTNVNGLLIHFLYLQHVGDYETMKLL